MTDAVYKTSKKPKLKISTEKTKVMANEKESSQTDKRLRNEKLKQLGS